MGRAPEREWMDRGEWQEEGRGWKEGIGIRKEDSPDSGKTGMQRGG